MSARKLLVILAVALMGCEPAPDVPPPPPIDARDSGRDAADAGTDAADAADAADAEVDATDAGDAQEVACAIETMELSSDPITRSRGVRVAATPRGFMFGWSETRSAREQVRVADLAEGASEPMWQQLTDDDNSAREVQVSDGFAIWIDDLATGEHFVIRGGNTTSTDPGLTTLSAVAGRHHSPRLFRTETGWLAFWMREEASGFSLQYRAFDRETAANRADVETLPMTFATTEYAVSFSDGQVFLSWVDGGDVRLVGFAPGEAPGAPITVGENGTGEVALAFDQGAGAVVFATRVAGVREELRLRLLDEDGAPVRGEQVVSRAPSTGRRPALVAYARGYAVAYRAREDGAETVRLAFLHGTDGTVVASYELAESEMTGGDIGIAVLSDGSLGLGWASTVPSDLGPKTVVFATRAGCDEAWLRCGAMYTESETP